MDEIETVKGSLILKSLSYLDKSTVQYRHTICIHIKAASNLIELSRF